MTRIVILEAFRGLALFLLLRISGASYCMILCPDLIVINEDAAAVPDEQPLHCEMKMWWWCLAADS